MYCRNCGNEVKDKSVVCSACGQPIGEGVDMPASNRRWSWFTMFVTLGIIVIMLLIAIIAGL